MPTYPVLCVEDNADIRVLLKTLLDLADVDSVGVPDVDAALRLMKGERFSLYVLDGGLPGRAGLSLCAQIRAAAPRTPIVIFSGHAHLSDIEAGLHAGANAYLVKPDSSRLISTIRLLLEVATE